MLTLRFEDNIFKNKLFLLLNDREIDRKFYEKKFITMKFIIIFNILTFIGIGNLYFLVYFKDNSSYIINNNFSINSNQTDMNNMINSNSNPENFINLTSSENFEYGSKVSEKKIIKISISKFQVIFMIFLLSLNQLLCFIVIIERYKKKLFFKIRNLFFSFLTIFSLVNFFTQIESVKMYLGPILTVQLNKFYFYADIFLQFTFQFILIFYFENSFILKLLATFFSFIFFFSLELWKINEFYEHIFNIAIYIFWCLINYKFDKIEKNIFVLFQKLNNSLQKTKILLDNLSSGLVLMKSNNIVDFNSKINDFGNFRKNTGFEIIYNPLEIKNFIFTGLTEFNNELEPKLLEIFQTLNSLNKGEKNGPSEKDYENFMNKLQEYKTYLMDDFLFIGKKTYFKRGLNQVNRELTLQISMKYTETDEIFEILVIDITTVVKNEELNAQNKYKKLFLNKFSHEFKNPILNINQLIKNFRDFLKQNQTDFLNLSSHQKEIWEEILKKSTGLKHVNNICNFMTTLITDFDILANIELNENKNICPLNLKNNKNNINSKDQSLVKECQIKINNNPRNIKNENNCENFISIYKDQVNIRKILKFCFEIFSTRIELNEKNIDINYFVEDSIPEYIISDERRLKQILINLVSNSYKFTNNGFINIRVVQPENGNSTKINFIVEDSGNGIKSEILQNICEPFKKIDIESNIYGAGLGLFIVKRLVEELGSNLEITSELQKGTKISFLINICDDENKEYLKNLEEQVKIKKQPFNKIYNKQKKNSIINFNSLDFNKKKKILNKNFDTDSDFNLDKHSKNNSISSHDKKIKTNSLKSLKENKILKKRLISSNFDKNSPNKNFRDKSKTRVIAVEKIDKRNSESIIISSGVFQNKSYTLNLLKKFTKISEKFSKIDSKGPIDDKLMKKSATDLVNMNKNSYLNNSHVKFLRHIGSNNFLKSIDKKLTSSSYSANNTAGNSPRSKYNTSINAHQVNNSVNFFNFHKNNDSATKKSSNKSNNLQNSITNLNSNLNPNLNTINPDHLMHGNKISNSLISNMNKKSEIFFKDNESNLSEITTKLESQVFNFQYENSTNSSRSYDIKFNSYKNINEYNDKNININQPEEQSLNENRNNYHEAKNQSLKKDIGKMPTFNSKNSFEHYNLNILPNYNADNFNFKFGEKSTFKDKEFDNSNLCENSNNFPNSSIKNLLFSNTFSEQINNLESKKEDNLQNKNNKNRNDDNYNIIESRNLNNLLSPFVNSEKNFDSNSMFMDDSSNNLINSNLLTSNNQNLFFNNSNIVYGKINQNKNDLIPEDKQNKFILDVNQDEKSNEKGIKENSAYNKQSQQSGIDIKDEFIHITNKLEKHVTSSIIPDMAEASIRSSYLIDPINNKMMKVKTFHKSNQNNTLMDKENLNSQNYFSSISKLKKETHLFNSGTNHEFTNENISLKSINTIENDNIGLNFNNNEGDNYLQEYQKNSENTIENVLEISDEKKIFRVLLVDDEKLIRESEVSVLKKFSKKNKDKFTEIEIVECIDGVECLFQVWLHLQQGIKFDAIITDQSMNFMRGSLLAQIIKNLIKENVMYDIKIFMVTSYEPHMITNTVGDDLLDDIYTKPLSIDNVRNILKHF